MKKFKPQHGGKRKGAGRPTGTGCKTCATLRELLDAAGKREERLMKQITTQCSQIGQVISSKFETFHVSEPAPESNVSPGLPIETLTDVNNYSDEEFVRDIEKTIPEKPN